MAKARKPTARAKAKTTRRVTHLRKRTPRHSRRAK